MNSYTYDDIALGHTESFSVTITEDMMAYFRAISGDDNPLHTDAGFATAAGFDDKVVYGMLTSSFMSTLAGVYLPGKHSLIQKIEAEFPKPTFVGDTLMVTGEVVDKNDMFKFIDLKVTIKTDQNSPRGGGENRANFSNNAKILRGKMRVGVLK